MWRHFQALPSIDRCQYLPPCTLVSAAPGRCPHAALLSVLRPLGSVCRQLGELRAVQSSSPGAFLSRIPSFPGRLQLGLGLPAHKVAEDTPAPSVADISYFPLSVFPSSCLPPLSSGWVGKEGRKVGTFPFLQLNLGQCHPHLRGPGRSGCSSCSSYQWGSG